MGEREIEEPRVREDRVRERQEQGEGLKSWRGERERAGCET